MIGGCKAVQRAALIRKLVTDLPTFDHRTIESDHRRSRLIYDKFPHRGLR